MPVTALALTQALAQGHADVRHTASAQRRMAAARMPPYAAWFNGFTFTIGIRTMQWAKSWLVRHLALVLLIKIVLITALWWAFFRGNKVPVDDARAATHLLGSPAATAPSTMSAPSSAPFSSAPLSGSGAQS